MMKYLDLEYLAEHYSRPENYFYISQTCTRKSKKKKQTTAHHRSIQ